MSCVRRGCGVRRDGRWKPRSIRDVLRSFRRRRARFGARRSGRARDARRPRRLRRAGGIRQPCDQPRRADGAVRRTALRAGDELPVGTADPCTRRASSGPPSALPDGGARRARDLGSARRRCSPTDAIETLLRSRFMVAPESNRMGYRLGGPASVAHAARAEMLSDATPMGSIQVTGSGQPILLMADRQTTGGYPRIATVISADLPLAGQLAPGDWIEFSACSRDDALDALREQELSLERIASDDPRATPDRRVRGGPCAEATSRSRLSPPSRLAARPSGW